MSTNKPPKQPSLPKIPKTKLVKAPVIPDMKEQMIVNLILRVLISRYKGKLKLRRNNTGAYKTETGGFIRYGQVGSPDIEGILAPNGRAVCLEVKTRTGKLSEHQERWLQEATDLGALVGVVRSVDEAIALIEGGLNSGDVAR